MKLSIPIKLEFTKSNFLLLLFYGAHPEKSPYSHKQIAEWCESFWNKVCDCDVADEIERIMPVLADIETQWDLYLVNTFTLKELQDLDFEGITLPVEWFENWIVQINRECNS